MLHSLALPPYESVKHLEGKGGYAVDKYYRHPYKFFYKKKLEMVLSYLTPGRLYMSILDFGCGQAKILLPSLQRRACFVDSVDRIEDVDTKADYSVIVCASVLEFVDLPRYLKVLREALHKNGMLIVASPMQTFFAEYYFHLIKDRKRRHSHKDILATVRKHFYVSGYKEWFGLYFSFKAVPK